MREWIQGFVFVGIVVPLAGVALVWSLKNGKWGAAVSLVIGVLLAAAFLFTPAGTWSTIGTQVGSWIGEQVTAISNGA